MTLSELYYGRAVWYVNGDRLLPVEVGMISEATGRVTLKYDGGVFYRGTDVVLSCLHTREVDAIRAAMNNVRDNRHELERVIVSQTETLQKYQQRVDALTNSR